MSNLDFGVTMTVLGAGGTLLILFLISLVMDLLNKILLNADKKKEAQV